MNTAVPLIGASAYFMFFISKHCLPGFSVHRFISLHVPVPNSGTTAFKRELQALFTLAKSIFNILFVGYIADNRIK
jgi:hypothetical protein